MADDALTPGTDSYGSLDELTVVLAARLGAGAWTNATEALRLQAARMACRVIEREGLVHGFLGTAVADDQVLQWPRSGVLSPNGAEYDDDAMPPPLIEAQAEEALALLARYGDAVMSAAARDHAAGIQILKIGDSSVTYGSDGLRRYGAGMMSEDGFSVLRPLLAIGTLY